MDELPRCTICRVRRCSQPPNKKPLPSICPDVLFPSTLGEVRDMYMSDDETRRLALAAARTEAAGYGRTTRIEDTIDFARRIGARRLGIASCAGLLREAAILEEILLRRGFEVASVCCKVGSVDKEEVGLRDSEKVRPGSYEALCNPIGQARCLNEAHTDLNIAVGLCVGHDSLFFKHSEAPATVLVAKDRVLAHNPAAGLYLSSSYYRRLLEDGGWPGGSAELA